MTIIRELGRHVRALGEKLTSENINNFGQKALHAGRNLTSVGNGE